MFISYMIDMRKTLDTICVHGIVSFTKWDMILTIEKKKKALFAIKQAKPHNISLDCQRDVFMF